MIGEFQRPRGTVSDAIRPMKARMRVLCAWCDAPSITREVSSQNVRVPRRSIRADRPQQPDQHEREHREQRHDGRRPRPVPPFSSQLARHRDENRETGKCL